MIIWTTEQPPAISCAYPLDAPGTLAPTFGGVQLVMDSPGYQTFTFTTLADDTLYLGLATDPLNVDNFPRPTTHPMAAQYTVTDAQLPPSPDAANYGALMVVVVSSVGVPLGNAYILLTGYSAAAVALGFGGFGELFVNNVAIDQYEFAVSVEGVSTAIYVNTDGTMGFTVAGVDYGAIPGLTMGATDKVFFLLRQYDSSSLAAGITMSGSFITSATYITEPMPTGATDTCGNAIA